MSKRNHRTLLSAFLTSCSLLMASNASAGDPMSPLSPGEKVADYAAKVYGQPYIIQRMTERTYWVAVDTFNATVVVGENGVLVIDPLSDGRAPKLLEAISKITDKPVTALVYSHSHMDHISDAGAFVEAVGDNIRIIATDKTVEQINYYSKPVPAPNEIVATPTGSFDFEGMTWDVHTRPDYGHSVDSSVFFFAEEKVAHAADLVEEGSLPFLNFNSAMSIRTFRNSVIDLIAMDWEFLNGGHGNIGSVADAEFYLEYIDDFVAATMTAIQTTDFGAFIDPNEHSTNALVGWSEAVADKVVKSLQSKYAEFRDLKPKMLGHVQGAIRDSVLHGAGAFE